MNKFLYWFVKLSALPVEWIYYKRKVYFYSKNQNKTDLEINYCLDYTLYIRIDYTNTFNNKNQERC